MVLDRCPPPLDQATQTRLRSQRQRETRPEQRLRRELRVLGLTGYRVHRQLLPALRRTADVVFVGRRVAVFVHGCWWHGCRDHWKPPANNVGWWTRKVEENRRRDAETESALHGAGWAVVTVWEHEDPAIAAARVAEAILTVDARRAARSKQTTNMGTR